MIAPTIIIGLGGIGSEICCRVSQQVSGKEQSKRIRFVCIDTDVNDLARRKNENPNITTIQTSAPYLVSNYLDKNTSAKADWFPNHNILMGKTPTEGAGQVRSISRLALEEAIRQGRMTELEKAIEDLYYLDGAAEPQAVRVMIVSSLAGGTGSGIVLPIALYVRNFLQTRFRKSASVIRGFFLLPEIMFDNKSPQECARLCCNAYASMRELDAFMRRGDGMLEDCKYENLTFKMPDPRTGNYVDYNVSPFNFCFLYDKRNVNDMQLRSFEDYKEHAANTIYAQTVSGMSGRSNSNEDNAIIDLVNSQGRNRLCGAGSSILKYPRDSVLRYIADNWCVESMDQDWLKIDKNYQKYVKEQKSLKKKNPSLKIDTLSEYYISQIKYAQEGTFESMLKKLCYEQSTDSDGTIIDTNKVDLFTAALRVYVTEQIDGTPEVADLYVEYEEKMEKCRNTKSKDDDGNESIEDKFHNAYNTLSEYIATVKRIGSELGRTFGMQIFGEVKVHEDDDRKFRIEPYLRDNDNKFVHPNAVRFFYYCLLKKASEAVRNAENTIKMSEGELRLIFDLKETTEIDDGSDFIEIKKIGKKRFLHKLFFEKKDQRIFTGKSEESRTLAHDIAIFLCLKELYASCEKYCSEISASYEEFYKNFDGYLSEVKDEIKLIEEKYENGDGKATRYVCASEKCLHKMLEKMSYNDSSSDLSSKISVEIYQKMKDYAFMVKKPNANHYFKELFNNNIISFWEGSVHGNYASDIDIDILKALELEAEYEYDYELTEEEKKHKVHEVLKQAERLAAPFVEDTLGEVRHPFTICAYHKDILGSPDSSRREFVNQYLKSAMGGQIDENLSKYELMVYKAIYNLNCGDFMRFCGPANEEEKGGTYYSAYIDNYKELGPNTSMNKVITSHLDKKWHLTKYLPDLDDRNQAILEKDIYTALAWGMISGQIIQTENEDLLESSKIIYKPRYTSFDNFIVSNGTNCDELFEVADALQINPPCVEGLLSNMKDTMKMELINNVSLENSKLMNCLNWWDKEKAFGGIIDEIEYDELINGNNFKLMQYIPKQKASIFDLIYWIKVSTPAAAFGGNEVSLLLNSMVDMIEDYIGQFVGESKKYKATFLILKDQFQLFLNNLKDDSIKKPRNRIKDEVVYIICNELDKRINDIYKIKYRDVMASLYNNAL